MYKVRAYDDIIIILEYLPVENSKTQKQGSVNYISYNNIYKFKFFNQYNNKMFIYSMYKVRACNDIRLNCKIHSSILFVSPNRFSYFNLLSKSPIF